MIVQRFDAVQTLDKPVKLPNGWLRVPARMAKTGVQEYRKADGSISREYRPPEEVFHPDALASFQLIPLTLLHPPEPLDSTNTHKYAVGAVGEAVKKDGDFVAGPTLVTHADAVEALLSKKISEASCGYTCTLDPTPGEINGVKYDAIQKNIRGNHLAIVPRGRAGPEVRFKLDAEDAADVSLVPQENTDKKGRDEMTVKIRIDGVDYDGTLQLEQAIKKRDDALQEMMVKHEKEAAKAIKDAEALKAKLDSVNEALEKEKKARADAEDPKKMRAAIASRLMLEQKADSILDGKVKLEALTDIEVKKLVLAKVAPSLKVDGKSDTYIEARFDAEMERLDEEGGEPDVRSEYAKARDSLRKDASREENREDGADEDAARARMLKANRSAWMPKESKA